MGALAIGITGIVALAVLLILRVPIAFAMFLVGFGGLAATRGWEQAISMAGSTAYHAVANWLYLVIPLFILMGEFAGSSEIIADLFSFFKAWFGKVRGSLGVVTILTSAVFAFATGSTLAATAVMGKIALPEMARANYQRKFSLSTVLAGGTLGNMIPPSIGLTLYGILTDQSIGRLLIAGILPGLLVTAMFIGLLLLWVARNPEAAPPVSTSVSWKVRWHSLGKTWGMLVVVAFVLGGIYSGAVTVTEAATVGAFGTFLIGLLLRRLSLMRIQEGLMNTMTLSSMIFFLLFSVALFTRFLALTGFTGHLARTVINSGVSPLLALTLIIGVYLLLGCIMDATSMMLLVVPMVYPMLTAFGFDPIWFGVLSVAAVQIGMITPPVGMAVYVLKGVSGAPLEECFWSGWAVLAIWLILIVLLIFWPNLALWLPRTM